MSFRTHRMFVGDFETTVYDGQTTTEVWASGIVELNTEDALIFGSIDATFEYLKALPENIIIYYHNLKFDGAFWLSHLICDLHLQQAYRVIDAERQYVEWIEDKNMQNNTFKYQISSMGQWYKILIKVKNKFIEIRDSVKLLPFRVKEIGEAFKTKHQKLEMEYKGERHANCYISPKEREYLINDLLVVKEALEIMFSQGHKALTIGSCCLKEYKRIMGKSDYEMFFPDMYKIPLDRNLYGVDNAGEYIRKSYKGGWCYLVEEKANSLKENGLTLDVNSLYPSSMHSESGNYYPVGNPCFWKGNYIPEKALQSNKYFYIRIRTRFYLKDGYLPFIQLKYDARYDGTEMLKTSDIEKDGKYYRYTKDKDGNIHDTIQTLTLTKTDYYLLLKHYELVDFEILDGCWFYAEIGLFDEYIDKYKKQKQESKGALRTLAKLFLNNLYGKMASNTDSSFKIAYEKEDGSLGFHCVPEHNKIPGYIPVGAAVTSYARCFTITAAQLNYYGAENRGFIYADTDSIHCDLSIEEIKGVTIHDSNFCCWKAEARWDEAIFTRQKTYIEHIVAENFEPIEKPYYNIKCAGMPEKCKKLFDYSMSGCSEKEKEELSEEELEFVNEKRTLKDFKIGLKVPGKLLPKRIKGGIVLVDTPFEIRE